MLVPTPHNEAKFGDIADVVLMPGDPLRAQLIADYYLKDVVCYNKVRNMLGFTGTYQGKRISVQGSGMGIPSIGIYSKELFEGYNVDTIIRIGSAGALQKEIELNDIVVAKYIDTDSNYLNVNSKDGLIHPNVSDQLLEQLYHVAQEKNIDIRAGKVFTTDTFYSSIEDLKEYASRGALAVEMETLALYTNAAIAGKNALAMFTISDKPIVGEHIDSQAREKSFTQMIELALELAIQRK